MRKAFNSEDTGVLDIKPMDEIVPEGIPSPQTKSFKHEEVFVNKKVAKSRMELIQEADVEEVSDITDPSETESVEQITDDEPPKKRGRGKRGKDKKPRTKKPPTEKQLAHLARIRELSKQRREAKKLEKERIKLEIKNKAKENTKKNAVIVNKTATKKPTQVIQKTAPPPNPNANNINPTNISQAPSMEQFFNLMERYEEYKEKKQKVKKAIPKAQSLPTGRKIEQKYKPAPVIDHNPLINETKNPFDICFSYGNRY